MTLNPESSYSAQLVHDLSILPPLDVHWAWSGNPGLPLTSLCHPPYLSSLALTLFQVNTYGSYTLSLSHKRSHTVCDLIRSHGSQPGECLSMNDQEAVMEQDGLMSSSLMDAFIWRIDLISITKDEGRNCINSFSFDCFSFPDDSGEPCDSGDGHVFLLFCPPLWSRLKCLKNC